MNNKDIFKNKFKPLFEKLDELYNQDRSYHIIPPKLYNIVNSIRKTIEEDLPIPYDNTYKFIKEMVSVMGVLFELEKYSRFNKNKECCKESKDFSIMEERVLEAVEEAISKEFPNLSYGTYRDIKNNLFLITPLGIIDPPKNQTITIKIGLGDYKDDETYFPYTFGEHMKELQKQKDKKH